MEFLWNGQALFAAAATTKKPNTRRKINKRAFQPTAKPGVGKAVETKNPVIDGELCWACLRENTLNVHLMVVRDDGAYEIQKYDRSLRPTGMVRSLGPTDMVMNFTRTRDGEKVCPVRGRLVKVARQCGASCDLLEAIRPGRLCRHRRVP